MSEMFFEYEDYVEKGGKEGLIPIRKTVTNSKTGKTFTRTYWCKPKDMASFKATAPAAEFLIKSIETQNELLAMVQQLEQYNTGLAAEIYNEMAKAGETQIKLADKLVEVSDWTTKRETNLGEFMAGLRTVLNQKGSVKMGDITEIYSDISYQYDTCGLAITQTDDQGKTSSFKKMSITQNLVPVNWANKLTDVTKAIRDNIKAGLGKVRTLWGKLGKAPIATMDEEKDFRRKENRHIPHQLEQEYSEKQASRAGALTETKKKTTEGIKAKAPTAGKKAATPVMITKPNKRVAKPKKFSTLTEAEQKSLHAEYKSKGGKLSFANFKKQQIGLE